MTGKPSPCIAIDGPSASGKSTVAREVARELGWIYVDSGALYRALTWHALERGVNPKDAADVVQLLQNTGWSFRVEQGALCYTIDGRDPGEAIRGGPVRENVSYIAAMPEVRAFIVDRLRETTSFGPVVMEGRDIGTVVFPRTPWKFYLDADPEVRARRRLKDIVQLEGGGDVREVSASLHRRDTLDRSRATAPLQVAADADVIDSSGMTAREVAT
ncbi:MAG: (d)CMP kinase, partial [Kiritimatiellae bacterium]|nr:(d)CMP kinase [Kiritimatiellia bacterium]